MSLLNRFGIYTKRDMEAYKARLANAAHLLATARQEAYTIPDTYGLYHSQAELFRRLPALSTAVEMLSNVGALVKASVMQRKTGEESQDVPNHPFELLLANPNPLQSGIEFMQDTIGFRALAGNAYWWLNRSGPNAPPAEMWVIQPDQILPAPDENMYLRGYLFDPGTGVKIPLETWEVVHFKRFNPFSRFVGLSVIEALAVTAIGDMESNKWNAQLFGENNARLPGILAFADPINDVDWKRLQAEARDKANKRELMMLRGVGAGGVQWMQAAATQREMEFLEGREFSRREIWDAIAPGLSSMLDPSATEASSKTGRDTFNDYAVWPVMCTMASKINSKGGLMQAYGPEFFVEFEDIRSRDKAQELQEQVEYSKTHTVDEIRKEKYGDKPIGDERGKLFPAQVNATSGGVQSDPKIDVQREQMTMQQQQAMMQDKKKPPMQDETMEEKNMRGKALKANENSAMIALRIPDVIREEIKKRYSFVDAETLADLHITLVYLGDNRTLDRASILKAVYEFGLYQFPIRGTLQGLARFINGQETDPLVCTFDSPQMPDVYKSLCGMLEENRILYHKEHGFIPHMTLAYIPKDAPMPIDTIEPIEINFSEIYYVDGGEWIPILLSGYANKTTEPQQPPAKSAYLEELNKWQRKALKHVGKVTPWDADTIPPSVAKAITDGMSVCKSEDDIRALFARHEKPQERGSMEIESIRLLLETAIKAMQTQEG